MEFRFAWVLRERSINKCEVLQNCPLSIAFPLDVVFTPCLVASGPNTSIVVNGPALDTGATLATVSAWGYQH